MSLASLRYINFSAANFLGHRYILAIRIHDDKIIIRIVQIWDNFTFCEERITSHRLAYN